MNLRSALVRLYPRPWRDRYGEEFEVLLGECLHSPLDVLDILLGALDAHLAYPNDFNWRLMDMVNKLRTTLLIVFTGYIGFVMGGLSLVGLVDDSPAAPLMKNNAPLFLSWTVIQIGSVISLLAVVAGSLPLVLIVIRRLMVSPGREGRLLLTPIIAFMVFVLYGVFLAAIGNGWVQIPGVIQSVSPENFPIGNRLLLGGLMLVFVLGAVASTAAAWKVIGKTGAEEQPLGFLGQKVFIKPYEYAFPLAVITTLGMLLMLVATLVFGWLASSALPGWFAGNFGLLLTNTTFSYAVTVAIMAISTGLAFFGLARGFPYWKRNSP